MDDSLPAPAFPLPPDGVRLVDVERSLIVQAMNRFHGNQSRAATVLGLTRYQLRYRLHKFGISLNLGRSL